MPGSGTRTFLDPDRYEEGLRQAQIELVITPRSEFKARLTWAELHHLHVMRCDEELARIAYMSLTPQLVFVTFPTGSGPLPKWRGMELQAGEIMFHSLGERLHQWTPGPSIWSTIAIDPIQLEEYGRIFAGKSISLPTEGLVLRPSRRDAARLRRLHTRVCRLAETKSKILTHPEVARAIEQCLIEALITSLTSGKVRDDGTAKRRHAGIMIRFEEVLAQHPNRLLQIQELSELIDVTDQTLRLCCSEFLGISPSRYVLLRRLKQVHVALREADPGTANLAELARACGFTEFGGFARAYEAVFGEGPPATLRRVPGRQFIRP
jgi:AraC-like DNA-binding protein